MIVTQGEELYELALFAGVGGGILGTKYGLGWRTVCYVERDPYAVSILQARIRDGYLDDAPIWDDVRTFDGRPWAGLVDVISAGFPCQPFSVAGKRAGAGDGRNGWPDTIRIIREVRPQWVFLENVPGLFSAVDKSAEVPVSYFGTVLGDLAASGYDADWRVLSAAEVGAPHKRDRVWIVAYDNKFGRWESRSKITMGRIREQRKNNRIQIAKLRSNVPRTDDTATPRRRKDGWKILAFAKTERFDLGRPSLPHAQCPRLAKRKTQGFGYVLLPVEQNGMGTGGKTRYARWWAVEPRLGRVAHGVAHRVDRLRAIGNGQVSKVAAVAFRLLTELTP